MQHSVKPLRRFLVWLFWYLNSLLTQQHLHQKKKSTKRDGWAVLAERERRAKREKNTASLSFDFLSLPARHTHSPSPCARTGRPPSPRHTPTLRERATPTPPQIPTRMLVVRRASPAGGAPYEAALGTRPRTLAAAKAAVAASFGVGEEVSGFERGALSDERRPIRALGLRNAPPRPRLCFGRRPAPSNTHCV